MRSRLPLACLTLLALTACAPAPLSAASAPTPAPAEEDEGSRAIRGSTIAVSNGTNTTNVAVNLDPTAPTTGSFKAQLLASNGKWVCAENGGGQELIANRDAAGPWETFTIVDQSHASLQDGDKVAMQASNGQYASAQNGGGGAIIANAAAIGPWELYIVKKVGGTGAIGSGDSLFLTTQGTGHYVCNESNGGQQLMANRTEGGPWETFKLTLP